MAANLSRAATAAAPPRAFFSRGPLSSIRRSGFPALSAPGTSDRSDSWVRDKVVRTSLAPPPRRRGGVEVFERASISNDWVADKRRAAAPAPASRVAPAPPPAPVGKPPPSPAAPAPASRAVPAPPEPVNNSVSVSSTNSPAAAAFRVKFSLPALVNKIVAVDPSPSPAPAPPLPAKISLVVDSSIATASSDFSLPKPADTSPSPAAPVPICPAPPPPLPIDSAAAPAAAANVPPPMSVNLLIPMDPSPSPVTPVPTVRIAPAPLTPVNKSLVADSAPRMPPAPPTAKDSPSPVVFARCNGRASRSQSWVLDKLLPALPATVKDSIAVETSACPAAAAARADRDDPSPPTPLSVPVAGAHLYLKEPAPVIAAKMQAKEEPAPSATTPAPIIGADQQQVEEPIATTRAAIASPAPVVFARRNDIRRISSGRASRSESWVVDKLVATGLMAPISSSSGGSGGAGGSGGRGNRSRARPSDGDHHAGPTFLNAPDPSSLPVPIFAYGGRGLRIGVDYYAGPAFLNAPDPGKWSQLAGGLGLDNREVRCPGRRHGGSRSAMGCGWQLQQIALGKEYLDGDKRKPIVEMDVGKVLTPSGASQLYAKLNMLSTEMFEDMLDEDWSENRVEEALHIVYPVHRKLSIEYTSLGLDDALNENNNGMHLEVKSESRLKKPLTVTALGQESNPMLSIKL